MSQRSLSRFPVPALDALPDDIRSRITAVQEKAGFVPNVFAVLAHRPAEFRAFFAYHDALMEKDLGLSRAEREMIVVATSAANQCQYCVVAHGALLRIYSKKPLLADQIAVNYRQAELSPRERAMLDFALRVATPAPRPWRMRNSQRSASWASIRRKSGTSAPSRHSSRYPIAWRA